MTRAFRLGLTGSIGMGKSATARLFADRGCAVWDADAAVHRLYATGGAAVVPVGRLCPEAVIDGALSRDRLKDWIATDATALARLEHVVHPLVRNDREAFFKDQAAPVVVFDIPLLFETAANSEMDAVAVVSADAAHQRARVFARPGMTEALFETLLAKQMRDEEKRARADWVIDTTSPDSAARDVDRILASLELSDARNRA